MRFADGNQVPAQIVGFDPFADVALLKVDPAGLTLRPLPLGSTHGLLVGSPVAAIGSPFGEEQSLSIGVISALDRSIQSLTGFDTAGAIQTDAAINHGNSGGPLLDARGPRARHQRPDPDRDAATAAGVGFAVPGRHGQALARRSCAGTAARATPTSAWRASRSTRSSPSASASAANSGAWIQDVTAGRPGRARPPARPAAATQRFQDARFRPGGDVVTAVEGTPVRAEDDLAKLAAAYAPGRDGDARRRAAAASAAQSASKLGERPLDAPPRLG